MSPLSCSVERPDKTEKENSATPVVTGKDGAPVE